MKKPKFKRILLWALPAILLLLLAGAVFFVYGVVPGKVAQAIVSKTAVHQPLTQSPKDYGLPYEDVVFPAPGSVTISGWWMKPSRHRKTMGTILLSHGFGKNRGQVLDRAVFLVEAGYQVLLFDQRGHGLSSNSPVSGGLLEAQDFSAGVEFLKERKDLKKPLVFFGFSLGAISALRAAVTDKDVEGVIADSPLSNLKAYVSRRTIGGTFAGLPGFLGRCLAAYDQWTGLSLKESDLDMIPVVEGLHTLPVLYITGEGDDLALSEEVRKLFEKTDSKHRRLVYIPDAGHEETYKKYPVVYERSVLGFLADLGKGFPKSKDSWPEKAFRKQVTPSGDSKS